MRTWACFAGAIVILIGVLAANGPNAQDRELSKLKIDCLFFYDADGVGNGVKKTVRVEVPVTSGPVPEIALDIPPKTTSFRDYKVEVSAGTNSLKVCVLDKKTDKPITSQLYQFGPSLKNLFVGGHGFTGLTYVHHPKTESKLQFWCVKAN